MTHQLQQDVRNILTRLADAILPVSMWIAGTAPPRDGALVPQPPTLPWRPADGDPTLTLSSLRTLEFFDTLFDEDSPNEALTARWLALKAYPLTHFQPVSGTAAAWRTSRRLNATAKFGVFDGESANNVYVIGAADGSRNPVSRQVFYAACWDPLLKSVQSAAAAPAMDLDRIDWTRFATRLLSDQFPDTWPSNHRVTSWDFVKRFAVDLLTACLGQRNPTLGDQDPLWQRAVLIEASENRHVGNCYTEEQVDAARRLLEQALAEVGG